MVSHSIPFLEPAYQALPSFYQSFQILPSDLRPPAGPAAVTGGHAGSLVVSQHSVCRDAPLTLWLCALLQQRERVECIEWARERQKGWGGATNRNDPAREDCGEAGFHSDRPQDLQIYCC